jgi:hypothetical protein
MRHILRRHFFLLIGLFTCALFALVAALGGDSGSAHAMAALMRILIVPMYLVWLLVTLVLMAVFGPAGPPSLVAPVIFIFNWFAGFAPYLLADYALDRWRRRRR